MIDFADDTATTAVSSIYKPPGVHPGVPMAEYHAWTGASNSRLTHLDRSPAHLQAYLAQPRTESEALRLGRSLHSAILEPDDFTSNYTVAGQCEATKKGDGLRCSNPGVDYHSIEGWLCGIHARGRAAGFANVRTVLSTSDYALCLGARDSVYRQHSAKGLLPTDRDQGAIELSLRWRDAETGTDIKARLDYHAPSIAGGTIVDVKSTTDASKDAFTRTIYDRGYHRQGALYLAGSEALDLPARHFALIAVEKEPPYAVAVYRLTAPAVDAGRFQLRSLLQRYAICVDRNQWPAYDDRVQDISLPDWAWKQIEDKEWRRTNPDAVEVGS
jgi:hypothetical protein